MINDNDILFLVYGCIPIDLEWAESTEVYLSFLMKHGLMSKIEKKKQKLQERINELESDLTKSLTQKTSSTAEINVGEQQRKINELKLQLKNLK